MRLRWNREERPRHGFDSLPGDFRPVSPERTRGEIACIFSWKGYNRGRLPDREGG